MTPLAWMLLLLYLLVLLALAWPLGRLLAALVEGELPAPVRRFESLLLGRCAAAQMDWRGYTLATVLLGELIAHPDKVLTQRHLLLAVWGPNAVEHTHYLRIYMGHLRQKLELDPERPAHLLTETGIGYRFVPSPERLA